MNSSPLSTIACLQKMADSAERQVRYLNWTWWALGVIAVLLGFLIYSFYCAIAPKSAAPVDWYAVDQAMDQGNLTLALETADLLLDKVPRDYAGHFRKGKILLMMGDRERARKSFEMAAQILPLREYKSVLEAMDKQ